METAGRWTIIGFCAPPAGRNKQRRTQNLGLHHVTHLIDSSSGFIHPEACCSPTNTRFIKSNGESLSMKVVYFIQNT